MLAARVVGGEALVVAQLRLAHQLRQPPPQRVVVGGDHHPPAVPAEVDVAGRDARQPRAGRLAHVAGLLELGDRRLEHREAGVDDRRIDDLAGGAALAGVEREQDALERRLGGERVAEADAVARRRLAGVAVDVSEARDRLAGGREPRALAVAAGLAVAGHARVDAAGVPLVHVVGPQAPALHRARAEVLQHDVGGGGELGGDPLPRGLAQVERDGALVAGQDRPPQAVVVVAQAPPVAHRVAVARRLDLDHVGAEVAQQRARVGAGEQLAELDRPQAVQRRVSHRWSSPPPGTRPRRGCASASPPRRASRRGCGTR